MHVIIKVTEQEVHDIVEQYFTKLFHPLGPRDELELIWKDTPSALEVDLRKEVA